MDAGVKIEQVGNHRLWVEAPDSLFLDLAGDITAKDIQELLVHVDRLGKGKGPVYFVQDLSKVGTFTAGARKTISEDPRSSQIAVVVCVGANFQMRVIMTMIEKTGRLLNRRLAQVRVAGTMDEARRMVAAERMKRT